jgi:hypothetical protein
LEAKSGCDDKEKHSPLANFCGTEDMKTNYDVSEQSNAIAIQKNAVFFF